MLLFWSKHVASPKKELHLHQSLKTEILSGKEHWEKVLDSKQGPSRSQGNAAMLPKSVLSKTRAA